MKNALLILIFIIALPKASIAETVIIEDYIKKSLSNKNIYELDTLKLCGRHNFHKNVKTKPIKVKKINFKNVTADVINVRYSRVQRDFRPGSVEKKTYSFNNCSDSERNDSRTVTVEHFDEVSFTTNKKIVSKAGLDVKFKIKAIHEVGISGSTEITLDKTKSTKSSTKYTEKIELKEKIKPYTNLSIDIENRIANAYVDIDADVMADADISVLVYYHPHLCKNNNLPYYNYQRWFRGKYSDLVGNRPIRVDGRIWNTKTTDVKKRYFERKLDKNNPRDCS